jgi:aminopeptidase YwaD
VQVARDQLWEHVRFLSQHIGARLSGTPADESTVQYMAEHFRRCGAQVEVQDFACPGWELESAELTLLGGTGPKPLPVFAQTFTESCDVEAELTSVGTLHELEFRPDLESKVLLLYGETGKGLALNRNSTLLSVEERRPAAVIVMGPSGPVSTKLIRDPFLHVPAAAVEQSVGLRLREREGTRVRLKIRARRYESVSHNVIGRLRGEGPGHIVVGAHYDTAACSPGATDDASGTAVVLELCRMLGAAGGLKEGIDFIGFGAEEYGRHVRALGSVEYVRRHPAQLQSTRAVIQLDGVGLATGPVQAHVMGWPLEQKADVLRVLRRFPRCLTDERVELGSDHVPFYLHGIPALAFIGEYQSVPIHTAEDTMDLMSPDELAFTAEVAASVVHHLACGGSA